MAPSYKLEESVSRIFMEAAFKLSGVLSADMFFLLQTGDGKRRFCGRDALVDDFVAGDLRFKDSDVHFRFFDDADQYDDADQFDDVVEDESNDVAEELSDVSESTLWGDVAGNKGRGGREASTSEGESSKRKASASPLEEEAPSEKAARKTTKAKKKRKSSDAASSIPSLMEGGSSANRRPSVEAKSSSVDEKGKRAASLDKAGNNNTVTPDAASASTPASDAAAVATTAPSSSAPSEKAPGSLAHVILRYLPENMADANIRSKLEYLFKKFGAKISEVQMIHKNPKLPRTRYAIVVCESRTQAHKVVQLAREARFRVKLNFSTQMTAEVIHKFDEHDPRATRTLRVTNLRADVDKAELRQFFEPFGEIYSFEMRHSKNEKGTSIGMAFIQFSQVEIAVKAREKLLGTKIKNHPLLISFVKSVKSDCVILNNVDTTGVVHQMKNRFGTLDDVYVKRDKRQAILFFRDVDCATKAMEVISSKKLAGANVQIDYASVDLQDAFLGKGADHSSAANPASGGGNDDAPAEKVNLVRLEDGCGIPVEKFEVADELGGITVEDGASDISDEEMEEVEEDGEGKEKSDDIVRGSPAPSDATSTSAGGPKIIRTSAAASNDDAERHESDTADVKSTDGKEEQNDQEGESSSKKRLFVGNLSGKITEEDIRAEFEIFGRIGALEMSLDNSYCFVSFEDDEEAHSKAMDALNGKKVGDVEMLICMD